MKQAAAVAFAGSIAAVAYYQGAESTQLWEVDQVARAQFDSYVAEYGKSYGTKEEYEFRLQQFAKNLKRINNHNEVETDDAVWGVNHMADWTNDEFKRLLGYKKPKHHHKNKRHHKKHHQQYHHKGRHMEGLPDSIDWRTEGAVTPVKNQGQCGSCWAFSSTGSMEGAYFLKNKELVSFSEQQLVDCSTAQGNQGCNGGLMDQAFTYAESAKMEKEADYPYTGRDGTCKAEGGVAVVTDFTDVNHNDPVALATALQSGPVSVAVDASLAWQFYMGGIVKRFCGTSLDHGVLLVGYGTEKGTDYWIIKNSWGSGWGEKGYIRIKRDMDTQGAGVCGLQEDPSWPQF